MGKQHCIDSTDIEHFHHLKVFLDSAATELLAQQSHFHLLSLFMHQLASVRNAKGKWKDIISSVISKGAPNFFYPEIRHSSFPNSVNQHK